jgi:hypothetical protein
VLPDPQQIHSRKAIVPGQDSGNVVLAAGRKDVYYDRIFYRRRPMLDASANDETIASLKVERFSLTRDFQMSTNHVDKLIVHVTVNAACPSLDHLMLDEKKLVVIRHDPAKHARLRFGLLRGITLHEHDIGKRSCLRSHLDPPTHARRDLDIKGFFDNLQEKS